MKIALVLGWILLVVEGLIVASMFVNPNMGDDAAGRAVARGSRSSDSAAAPKPRRR